MLDMTAVPIGQEGEFGYRLAGRSSTPSIKSLQAPLIAARNRGVPGPHLVYSFLTTTPNTVVELTMDPVAELRHTIEAREALFREFGASSDFIGAETSFNPRRRLL